MHSHRLVSSNNVYHQEDKRTQDFLDDVGTEQRFVHGGYRVAESVLVVGGREQMEAADRRVRG